MRTRPSRNFLPRVAGVRRADTRSPGKDRQTCCPVLDSEPNKGPRRISRTYPRVYDGSLPFCPVFRCRLSYDLAKRKRGGSRQAFSFPQLTLPGVAPYVSALLSLRIYTHTRLSTHEDLVGVQEAFAAKNAQLLRPFKEAPSTAAGKMKRSVDLLVFSFRATKPNDLHVQGTQRHRAVSPSYRGDVNSCSGRD